MSKHIHSLKAFLSSLPDDESREAFAKICGTTYGQLRQIYYGNRTCDAGLAIEIEKHSNKAVACDDLRPDVDFEYLRQPTTEEG